MAAVLDVIALLHRGGKIRHPAGGFIEGVTEDEGFGQDWYVRLPGGGGRSVRVARMALAVLVAGGLLSGCGHGPTLQAATAELQKDLHRLETDRLFKNPLTNLRIVERPDRDLPCDKDKFERVLRVTADYEHVPGVPVDNHLDHAQRIMENKLSQVLHYKVSYDFTQVDWKDARLIEGRKDVPGITVNVIVVPESPTWRLTAKTDCLARS